MKKNIIILILAASFSPFMNLNAQEKKSKAKTNVVEQVDDVAYVLSTQTFVQSLRIPAVTLLVHPLRLTCIEPKGG